MKLPVIVAATLLIGWQAHSAQAAQLAQLGTGKEVCDSVRSQLNLAGALYEQYNALDVGTSDVGIAILKQLFLNNVLLTQLSGLTIM